LKSVVRYCLSLMVFFLMLMNQGFVQLGYGQESEPFSLLLDKYDLWSSENPVERVYLHTDKPYYVAGDTIWFKAYVVQGSGNTPSSISGAVYADLIGDPDSVVHALKLPLFLGMGKGSFTLSEGLAEGNYRVRAYTQWMRNAGPDHF